MQGRALRGERQASGLGEYVRGERAAMLLALILMPLVRLDYVKQVLDAAQQAEKD